MGAALLPSRVLSRPRGGVTIEFELRGQCFVGIDGGPQFPFTEAVSFEVPCQDQTEVDRYRELLLQDGGTEVQCGWLKDRFGLAWQVTPVGLLDLLDDPDPERARRATEAMLKMVTIDLAAVQAAADGQG